MFKSQVVFNEINKSLHIHSYRELIICIVGVQEVSVQQAVSMSCLLDRGYQAKSALIANRTGEHFRPTGQVDIRAHPQHSHLGEPPPFRLPLTFILIQMVKCVLDYKRGYQY